MSKSDLRKAPQFNCVVSPQGCLQHTNSLRFVQKQKIKVSVWELSDDFGTACDPFLLVGETVVSRQQTVRQYHMIR